jgi:hypothetical protein
LGLEKIVQSLIEQVPTRLDETLQERKNRLEQLGMVALSIFGLGVLGLLTYGIGYKLMLTFNAPDGLTGVCRKMRWCISLLINTQLQDFAENSPMKLTYH